MRVCVCVCVCEKGEEKRFYSNGNMRVIFKAEVIGDPEKGREWHLVKSGNLEDFWGKKRDSMFTKAHTFFSFSLVSARSLRAWW